ncbi:MAG: MFS transporter [Chloroflexota bacterium]
MKLRSMPLDLALLTLAMIVANVAGNMTTNFQPLYLESLGANVKNVGVYFTVLTVMAIIFRIFGGWFSDNAGRLRSIAWGGLLGLIAFAGNALAPAWGWAMLGGMLLEGGRALVGPSFQAYIAESAPEGSTASTFGLVEALFLTCQIIGPILGGLLIDRWGFKPMLWLATVIFALGAAMRGWLALSRPEKKSGDLRPVALRRSVSALLAVLIGGGLATWLFVADGLRDSSISVIWPFLPKYVTEVGGQTETMFGGLLAGMSVVMALGNIPGGLLADRLGERWGIAAGGLLMAASMAVFVLYPTAPGFWLAFMIYGLSYAFVHPALSSLLSKAVPKGSLGMTYGLFWSAMGLLAVPAPYLGALLYDNVAPRMPFLVAMGVVSLTIPVALFKLKAPVGKGTPGWQRSDDRTRPHLYPVRGQTPTSDVFATLADLPGKEEEPSTLIRERQGRRARVRNGGFQRRTVKPLLVASALMCIVILGGLSLFLLTGSLPEQAAPFAAPMLSASGGRAASVTPSPTVTLTPGDEGVAEVTGEPTREGEAGVTPTLVPSVVTDEQGILLNGISMVYLPGGAFLMGSAATGPIHEVTLSPYYVDKYEVTNGQWTACVAAGACSPPASTRAYDGTPYYGVEAYDDYPVIFVDWYSADSYCRWRGARLPTEAEWEMAARWDVNEGVGTLYPWGDAWDNTRLNYCSGGCPLAGSVDLSYDDGWAQAAPVGSFPTGVSPAGLLDMSGNVAEWVADRYSAGYYAESPAENPTGPESGSLRVVRGGSWGIGSPALLTATLRSSFAPSSQSAGLGFRCAIAASAVTR